MEAKKISIEEIFIVNFIRQVIKSSNNFKKNSNIIEKRAERILEEEIKKPERIIEIPIQPQKQLAEKRFLPIPSQRMRLVGPSMRIQQNLGVQEITGKPSNYITIEPAPNPAKKVNELNLGQLKPLIANPSIISVECPGPDKPIILNKSGLIQTTPIILSSEEINTIMNEISERTKIPLIGGVFKAALGDMIITALISEFLGTRFVIQRMKHINSI